MEETYGKSIAALTLGILSIMLPFIGLILGIIGLVMSRNIIKEVDIPNDKSKGLAVAGKVCCIVGICIQLLIVLSAVLGIAMFFTVESGVVEVIQNHR